MFKRKDERQAYFITSTNTQTHTHTHTTNNALFVNLLLSTSLLSNDVQFVLVSWKSVEVY